MPTIRKGSLISTATPSSDMTDDERAAIDRRVPRSRAWKTDEHAFQKSLFAEMNLRSGWEPRLRRMFAVPNAAKRSPAVAGRMKAEGMKPGVPDVFLPIAACGKHGLWLELKKKDATASTEQWEWLLALHRGGYAAHLVNDVNTARDIILSYLESR